MYIVSRMIVEFNRKTWAVEARFSYCFPSTCLPPTTIVVDSV